MSNQFLKLRRSAVQGKIPETSSLDLGELAINTYDGQLFLKKSGSQGEIVTVVGSTGSFTGSFSGNGSGLSNIPASGITGLNLSRIATGSITASVSNTDISASFRITSGSNTLLNVTRDGFVWIGNGSFVNQGYQLDVQGTARVSGKTTISATTTGATDYTLSLLDSNTTIGPSILMKYSSTVGTVFSQKGLGLDILTDTNIAIGSFRNNGKITFGELVTSTPITTFNVAVGTNTTANDGLTIVDNTSDANSSSTIGFYARNASKFISRIGSIVGSAYNQGKLTFSVDNGAGTLNELMRMLYTGNILVNTTTDITSSIFTIASTTKGFLPPRTNSTASITSPAQGLLTYITASGDTEGLWQYRTGSNGWVQFLHNSSSIPASSIVGLNLSQIATGSVTASVSNTDISASFRITSGSNTLLNVTRDGFVWIGNGAFSNQAYQLDVQGTGRFTNNLEVDRLRLQANGKIWYNNAWGERWSMNLAGDGDMSFNSVKGNQSITFRGESTYTYIIASNNVPTSSIFIGTFEGRQGYIVATQNANTGNYTAATARIAAGYTPGTVSPSATNTQGVPLYINAANGGGSGLRADIVFQTVDDIAYGPSDTHQLRDRIIIKGGSGNTLISASLYVSGSFILNGTQFNNTSSLTSAGITTVSQLSTSSYTSCFYNYTVASASNARAGQVMSVWNGSTLTYTEVVTTDIGNTSQVIVSSSLSTGLVRLQVSASAGWTFKNISNLL